MFKGWRRKKKHVWQSFPCSAFRSKLAKIQPMGEHFHLPPPLHTVCNSCFSQEGGPLYSLLAISVGSIWSALNNWNMRKPDSLLQPLWTRLCNLTRPNGPLHRTIRLQQHNHARAAFNAFHIQSVLTIFSTCMPAAVSFTPVLQAEKVWQLRC